MTAAHVPFLGLVAVVVLGLYFLPTIVAVARWHPNASAIFVLSLLLGWSGLGWVAALVWALMVSRRWRQR